jgi:hypothetical protein
MEKYGLKKIIQKKLNIPITPENVYVGVGKHEITNTKEDHKNVKYLDQLYSAAFMDDYFS